MNPRRLLLALFFAAGLVAVVVGGYALSRPQLRMVHGALVDVQATSIVYAESISLRDGDGRVWTFQVSPEVATHPDEPQSASHLRQHLFLGEWLRVYYRETPEGLLAVRISDDDIPPD
jgi:hypothetical protein